MRTRGSIKQISNNSWKITIELPKNELTGKRQQKFFTFHGTRKEAEKYKT